MVSIGYDCAGDEHFIEDPEDDADAHRPDNLCSCHPERHRMLGKSYRWWTHPPLAA